MAADARPHPLEVIRRARSDHDVSRVIVALSCGKDAAATLALCVEHFGVERVSAYFMYFVAGLSFQEQYLRAVEGRYGFSILRIPHWDLARQFRNAEVRHPTKASKAVPRLKISDVEAHVRKHFTLVDPAFSTAWIATGEKASDSVERNAVIKKANGIDPRRRRIWPIGFWPNNTVHSYLRSKAIPLSSSYGARGAGVDCDWPGPMLGRDLIPIRDHYPEDYAKILRVFPFAEAKVIREEQRLQRLAESGATETRRRHH